MVLFAKAVVERMVLEVVGPRCMLMGLLRVLDFLIFPKINGCIYMLNQMYCLLMISPLELQMVLPIG